jgi:hypothetical protein
VGTLHNGKQQLRNELSNLQSYLTLIAVVWKTNALPEYWYHIGRVTFQTAVIVLVCAAQTPEANL